MLELVWTGWKLQGWPDSGLELCCSEGEEQEGKVLKVAFTIISLIQRKRRALTYLRNRNGTRMSTWLKTGHWAPDVHCRWHSLERYLASKGVSNEGRRRLFWLSQENPPTLTRTSIGKLVLLQCQLPWESGPRSYRIFLSGSCPGAEPSTNWSWKWGTAVRTARMQAAFPGFILCRFTNGLLRTISWSSCTVLWAASLDLEALIQWVEMTEVWNNWRCLIVVSQLTVSLWGSNETLGHGPSSLNVWQRLRIKSPRAQVGLGLRMKTWGQLNLV